MREECDKAYGTREENNVTDDGEDTRSSDEEPVDSEPPGAVRNTNCPYSRGQVRADRAKIRLNDREFSESGDDLGEEDRCPLYNYIDRVEAEAASPSVRVAHRLEDGFERSFVARHSVVFDPEPRDGKFTFLLVEPFRRFG